MVTVTILVDVFNELRRGVPNPVFRGGWSLAGDFVGAGVDAGLIGEEFIEDCFVSDPFFTGVFVKTGM